MKRPILIVTIGYIIGIIVGLYFNQSIVFIYVPIVSIYLIKKFKINEGDIKKLKLFSIKRYIRYLKIYLNSKVIVILIISSIISNTIVLINNQKYEKIYNSLSNQQSISFTGVVISQKQEKQYNNKYKVKIPNKNLKFYITTKKNIELKYGDKVNIKGTYIRPEVQRNYKGFDYSQYLKQIGIFETLKHNEGNKLFQISNIISTKVISNTNKILNKENSSVLLGLMLGYKEDIDEEIQENFKNASMVHVLAVSGMHISYIILGINILFNKIIGKRKTYILSVFVLMFYMFITNFTPSVTRAGIMGILMILSKLIYRKNDIYTSISISLLLSLIYNPFSIQNLGLQLSYGGVIGIIIFNKWILKVLNNVNIRNKIYKYIIKPKIQKYIDNIKQIISISLSVQLVVLPIVFYNSNIFTPYFLISNLFLSFVIGPIVMIGFIFIIIELINMKVATVLAILIEVSIKILNFISRIGKLPLSKIYIPTPKLFSVLIYFIFIVALFVISNIYLAKKPNMTQMRAKNLIALINIKLRTKKLLIQEIFILISLIIIIANCISNNLNIYFIDVGQGDSTLIVTPHNKIVLIDGGGSSNSEFDVGKNTLLPYILDRGFTKIDFIIVSHFDTDHVGGLLTIMEELKVGTVIISKQGEYSENYQRFKEIIKEKKIKIIIVDRGDRLQIEKDLYFDILWPNNERLISENILNNNSIVCKLNYKNFSMLFTGDIEEIAEKQILEEYENNLEILKSTVLKVGHHGSKTSSTQEFIEAVKSPIALIGVGENNKFGHPNDEVIEKLENLRYKNLSHRPNGRNFNNSK